MMERVLRVNLTTGDIRVESLPADWRLLGGRSLTARILTAEADPGCDPLGPGNILVWAPGLLSGTVVSSSSRVSVGCKSPLTGGIKESNAGGQTGLLLAQAGYRAVIVSGAAAPGTWHVLVIDGENVRLEPPPPSTPGAGAYAAADELFRRYGRQCALALCGPAGEQRMGIAGIGNTDREGRPSRLNARGAVGAVMGAKGLKALAVMGDQRRPVPAPHPEQWKQGTLAYHRVLRESPVTGRLYPDYGTLAVMEKVNRLGGLPTRNFSAGSFAGAEAIGSVATRELILARGGEGMTTHACMTGCAIRCSNVFPDAGGREVASSMEFETHGLMGSNLGIDDLDAIARFTRLCNDLGADTIETGAALGVAMEAGLLPWGDAAAIERVLDRDVRRGTPLGRIIGAGAGTAGRVLGIRRVPVVKNQAISAYDPRALKGNGVTYCTSPMGADHTAGNTIAADTDHLDPRGKVALSRDMQIRTAIMDILGFCSFARGLLDPAAEAFLHLFNGRLDTRWEMDDLRRHALAVIRAEVAFNRAAGLGPGTDRLPEWFREERLPPHSAVFDVPDADLDAIWTQD